MKIMRITANWMILLIVDFFIEEFDQCVGKYTIGLGQKRMAVCPDNEDVTSISLSGLWKWNF